MILRSLLRGSSLDAIERLHWLEAMFRDLNLEIERCGEVFWNKIKLQSDAMNARSGMDSDEILPVPKIHNRYGWKKRVPLSE